ncbi:MAG: septal ring lytic transglycosylase RlpA family protein [Saprospiraceae bacterium]
MRKLQHFSLLFFFSFCFLALTAQEEYGLASQYGDEFDGSATASGQAYDKNKLTAAHKTLPMGTKVRVTRLDNKKSVVVRINDRGPYIKGRIIDLSGRAAAALDMLGDVKTEIKLEVVGKNGTTKPKPAVVSKPVIPKSTVPVKKPEVAKTAPAKKAVAPKKRPAPATTTSEPIVITPKGKTKATTKTKAQVARKAAPEDDTPEFELVTGKDYKQYDLYKVQLTRPAKEGYGVQIGVFSDYDNTMKRVAELQGQWFKNILMSIEKGANGQKKYKLILGPFPDMKTATSYKKHAKKNKKIAGFVVDLAEIKAAKK